MNKKYWNEGYWKNHLQEHKNEDLDFTKDLWITKYDNIINSIPKNKALDLGCGIGQYTKYLIEKGFFVTSADISIEALKKLKETIKEANTIELDMSNPLPFNDNEFELVFANLSIHYFDKQTTQKVIQEIKRILKPNGYFIGTVNSTKAYEFIKDHATFIEDNYYHSKGRNVRLWNKEQFKYFFQDFEEIVLTETQIIRWNKRKDMWEFIYKNIK